MNQGDTIVQTCAYASYDGKFKKAISWGNVKIKDPQMILESDTIHFDRVKQEFYYPSKGKISSGNDVLTSDLGTYFLKDKKFKAQNNVLVKSEESTMITPQLDYFHPVNSFIFMAPLKYILKRVLLRRKKENTTVRQIFLN